MFRINLCNLSTLSILSILLTGGCTNAFTDSPPPADDDDVVFIDDDDDSASDDDDAAGDDDDSASDDDDAAGELDVHERLAHGSNGGAVGGDLVAFAQPSRGGDGGGFGDADHLEREVAVARREGAAARFGGDLVDDVVLRGGELVRLGVRFARLGVLGRVALVGVDGGERLVVLDAVVLEHDVLGDGAARVGDRDDLRVRPARVAAAEGPAGVGRIGPPERFEPLRDDGGGRDGAHRAARAGSRASKWLDGGTIRRQGGGCRAHFVGYTVRGATKCASLLRQQLREKL